MPCLLYGNQALPMATANAPRPPPCSRLAARRLVARVAAADAGADQSSPSAVRKALLARGWDLAWIDGVTGEMIKGRLSASVPQMEAAVSWGSCRAGGGGAQLPRPPRTAAWGCPRSAVPLLCPDLPAPVAH